MLWLSARLEWKILQRDRVFWIALAMFAGLVALAAISSRHAIARDAAQKGAALAAESARIEELQKRLPTDTLRIGQELLPRVAHLPNAPLASVSVGQRQLRAQTVKLTTRPRTHEGSRVDASSAATGSFDLAFLLVFLVPLLVIGASFDLLSREREQGTLSLVLSQPISLSTFMMGKASARMFALLGVTLVLGLGGALVAGAELGGTHAIPSLALFALLSLAHTFFWFALALLVNAYGRSSAANALTLMVLWLGLVVVVPGLASVAVDAALTGPSRSELVTASRDAARETDQRLKQAEGNHGSSALPPLDVLAIEREHEREVAPVLEAFNARLRKEQGLIDTLRFLSPATLVNEGLSDLSGSGATRHRQFEVQVDGFHDELRSFFEQRLLTGATLSPADYDAMPRFRWVEPSPGSMVSRVGGAVLALAAAALLLLAMAIRRLRRPPLIVS